MRGGGELNVGVAECGDKGREEGGEEGILKAVVRTVAVKVKPVCLGDKG